MRSSYYNTVLGVDGNTILFNAFTGQFIVIRGNNLTGEGENLQELALQYPSLSEQLVKYGSLTDCPEKQLEILKGRISAACSDNSIFILNINPTLDCNFSCWYCYENHRRDSVMSKSIISAVKNLIVQKLSNNQELCQLQLNFFGGEPLLKFDEVCSPIIHHACNACTRAANVVLTIGFTSNGSLVTDRIAKFLSSYSCSFQITLDGGEIHHNKTRFFKGGKPSYKLIIDNIKNLANHGIKVIVRVNFTSKNIDSALQLPDEFSNINDYTKKLILFDFQRVWQDRSNKFDETEQKAVMLRIMMRKAGFTVLTNNLMGDARNVCYGDCINHILVNYNGDIFKCTARDFTSENRVGILKDDGSIDYDSDINQRRDLSKFAKRVCQTCRIAPICGGGCKQRSLEDIDSQQCTFRYTDENINNKILDIFDYKFCHSRLKEELND